jgi:dienelactone hydrolase
VAQTREARAFTHAVGLVPYVFPDAPIRPLDWVTPAPPHTVARYSDGARDLDGDLYEPGTAGRHPALVLSLGVHPVSRDDPALVRIATGLARDGFVVLVPDSPDLRADRILPSERDAFVAAFRYVRALDDVDRDRVGLVGFSAGASLLTVAAADVRIRDDVRMVNFFGGYYDAEDLLREVASREIVLDDGRTVPWEPAPLARQIFGAVMLQSVEDERERASVSRVIVDGLTLPTEDRDRLGARALLVYELFTASDAARVDSLMASLPDDMRQELREISPRTYVGELRAKMLVMHDVDDAFVPYVESRRLVAALPARQREYTEFAIFAHVEPTRSLDVLAFVGEVGKLLRHVYLALYELS